MAEYILLFRGGDSAMARKSPEEFQTHMQQWMVWMGQLSEKGKLVGAQPLDKSGRQIRGNKKIVTDGPFMEGKEMVGGYLICVADDYDAAVALAKDCPVLEFEDGVVEVRAIQELKT
jgi:hypothetical protein